MAAAVDDVFSLFSCRPPSVLRPSALLVSFCIALPHFLYAFIWFRPEQWRKMFPKNPVDAFATAGLVGKREYQPAEQHSSSSALLQGQRFNTGASNKHLLVQMTYINARAGSAVSSMNVSL